MNNVNVPRAEKIMAALTTERKQGVELSTAEIKRIVREAYPEIPESSILPADFCRNHKNADPFSGKYPLFDKVGPDKYVFLGK